MEKFFNLIYRLKFIERWATSFSLKKENVAEHSYIVAVISHILAMIDVELNKSCINPCEIAVQALYCYSFECFTSHIISPIKSITPGIKDSFDELKKIYSERLFKSVPEEFQKCFQTLSPSEKSQEIISMSKSIATYLYCFFQVSHGNSDFKNKAILEKKRIDKLKKNYNYVNCFFENFCNFKNLELDY